jgi:hypothetical protein
MFWRIECILDIKDDPELSRVVSKRARKVPLNCLSVTPSTVHNAERGNEDGA